MSGRSTSFVALFLTVAFGWAWFWWGLEIFLLRVPHGGPGEVLGSAADVLGGCSPLIAAWVVWWRSGGARHAWRSLGRTVRPRGPWLAWALPTLAIVGLIAVASFVHGRTGAPGAEPLPLGMLLPMLVIQVLLGGGQEEVGWRGWLHPTLRARMGRWGAPLLVGMIWFCWHLPLWWVPGSIQSYLPPPTFAAMTIGLSLLMARALELTGGRAAVTIWLHAVNNLAGMCFVFITPVHGALQLGAWVMGGEYLLVGVAAMFLRRRRTVTTAPPVRGGERPPAR